MTDLGDGLRSQGGPVKTYIIDITETEEVNDDDRLLLRMETSDQRTLFSNLMLVAQRIAPEEYAEFMQKIERNAQRTSAVMGLFDTLKEAVEEATAEKAAAKSEAEASETDELPRGYAPDGSRMPS